MGWPRLIDDQAEIAGSFPILPIFLKEDVAKIGGVKKNKRRIYLFNIKDCGSMSAEEVRLKKCLCKTNIFNFLKPSISPTN